MSNDYSDIPEEFRERSGSVKDWKEIVAWVGDLPPLPHVAARALALIEDPDTTAGQLSALLGGDTALAARVLKIANSAMFSRQREITTINQAVMTVGFKTLKGIIIAATLRQLNREFGKIEKLIWENSACSAIGALRITQALKRPYVDEAFLLGLLHDLGKLILMRQVAKDYSKLVGLTKEGRTFVDVEQEHLGFTHALIGALVAKKWNFSLETCQIILHHHDPIENAAQDEMTEKTAVIQFSNLIAHKLGYGHFEGYPETTSEMVQAGGRLGFDEARVKALVEEISTAFAEQGGALM